VCTCDIYQPPVTNVGDKKREYLESLAKAECLKKCPPPDVLDKLLVTIAAFDKAKDVEGSEA